MSLPPPYQCPNSYLTEDEMMHYVDLHRAPYRTQQQEAVGLLKRFGGDFEDISTAMKEHFSTCSGCQDRFNELLQWRITINKLFHGIEEN